MFVRRGNTHPDTCTCSNGYLQWRIPCRPEREGDDLNDPHPQSYPARRWSLIEIPLNAPLFHYRASIGKVTLSNCNLICVPSLPVDRADPPDREGR